jgi:hypothetical protein
MANDGPSRRKSGAAFGDGKGQDLAAELPGQELQSLLNPGLAVIFIYKPAIYTPTATR